MSPLIFVNPLAPCWAVHLQSVGAWLGKSAFAHLAFLHGVSLSFAKRIHPTAMIRFFIPFRKLAWCSPFLCFQGHAMKVTGKGINQSKNSWESHILIKYIPCLPKCQMLPFFAHAREKKSENAAIYLKHIWESRSCSSWATTAGVTGACIPHDCIRVCSGLLRHSLEPQIEQSNISALLESSRGLAKLCNSVLDMFWFVALSETPKNTSFLLYNMPDPASLDK